MTNLKRNLLLTVALLALLGAAYPQVNTAPLPLPIPQFFSATGQPLSGGKVFTYLAGTTTPAATYTDGTGLVTNSNPIILNAGGFPTNGSGSVVGIWLGPQKYKIILQNSLGVQQWLVDQVGGNNLFSQMNLNMAESTAPTCTPFFSILWGDSSAHRTKMCNNSVADFVVGQNTTDTLSNKTLISPVVTSPSITSETVGGTNTHTGTDTFASINTIKFASQFSGADASCKIQAAITALPTNGGAVYAYDLSDSGGTGACAIDPGPGGKTVTLFLGPYQYNITQITLRSNFSMIGVGASNCTEPCNATLLQSTVAGTDPIVIPSTPPVIGVWLQNFSLNGAAGNTSQNGLSINPGPSSGLWGSTIQSVSITGFKGIGILLNSQAAGTPGAINQFLAFRDVTVFRVSGGGPAVKIIGFNGQYSFDRCQFDGQAIGDGIDVVIAQGTPAPTDPPYSITFRNVTMQKADHALDITGATTFQCDTCHFETLYGVLNATNGANFNNYSIALVNSFINGDVGIHGGAGYVIHTTSTIQSSTIQFHGNFLLSVPSAPDHLFTGQVDNITAWGNTVGNHFPYNSIGGGLDPNGGGFKHIRTAAGCATAASLAATCDTTVTWGVAFIDAFDTPVCTGYGITSGVPLNGGITANAAGNVVFRTVSGTAAAAQYAFISCIAVHDIQTNF